MPPITCLHKKNQSNNGGKYPGMIIFEEVNINKKEERGYFSNGNNSKKTNICKRNNDVLEYWNDGILGN